MKSNLSFLEFLQQYVKDLAGKDTLDIQQLLSCCNDFPKLREPLFVYAVISGRLQELNNTLLTQPNPALYELCNTYGLLTIEMLQQQDGELPERVLRVWTSYVSVRDSAKTENHVKELMRQRILLLLQSQDITSSQLCDGLHLNPAWLEYGDSNAISYDDATKLLDHVESLTNTED